MEQGSFQGKWWEDKSSGSGWVSTNHVDRVISTAVSRAVRAEQMQIADGLYNQARYYKKREFRAESESGDQFDSVALMYYHMRTALEIEANDLAMLALYGGDL